ncbi:MAG: hypothetical protein AAF914_04420 [Pseudomonadota bacterium]
MMRTFLASAAALSFASAVSASTVLFHDDFSQEDPGSVFQNTTTLDNWTVVQGNVDLIGSTSKFACEGGTACLDLDGFTTPTPAIIETIDAFHLQGGETYTLLFAFAGGTNNDTVTVALGSIFQMVLPAGGYTIPFAAAFSVTPQADELAQISFAVSTPPDSQGPYLGEVTLIGPAPIPLPAGAWFLIGGFGMLAFAAGRPNTVRLRA